jgi:hypothetical protein
MLLRIVAFGTLSFIASVSLASSSNDVASPAEIRDIWGRQTCHEHIVRRGHPEKRELPRLPLGRDFHALAVASFDLDGSGRAQNFRIVESKPTGLLDKGTLGALKRTEFTKGVIANNCKFVQTFSVRRS